MDITAYLDAVETRFQALHEVDPDRVQAIIESVTVSIDEYGEKVIDWDLPPVLVVEDAGNGHVILDGHHRCAAAQILEQDGVLEEIPAWIIESEDYCRILGSHFDGDLPARLSDLRELVRCGSTSGDDVCQHGEAA